MLEFKNITKQIGNKVILENCNLVIEQGTITGLIGVNGAGKTTLLRCIAGIYQVEEGSITYESDEVYENNDTKKDILFLSDELYFEKNATMNSIKEFYQAFYPRFDQERYDHYVEVLKLDKNEYIRNFSKGMKRQAYIIIMLALQPKVLLLDESFDGLDPVMKSIIKKAILQFVEEYNTTVIISSHSLSDIETICDHYVILDHKQIESHQVMQSNDERYHRLVLAFEKPMTMENFKGLPVIKAEFNSQIVTLVLEGNYAEIEQLIDQLQPIMKKRLSLSLEEIFVSKMEDHHE